MKICFLALWMGIIIFPESPITIILLSPYVTLSVLIFIFVLTGKNELVFGLEEFKRAGICVKVSAVAAFISLIPLLIFMLLEYIIFPKKR